MPDIDKLAVENSGTPGPTLPETGDMIHAAVFAMVLSLFAAAAVVCKAKRIKV